MHHSPIRTGPHHGHGLADDLAALSRLEKRRRTLAWVAALAGHPLLAACGGGGSSSTTPVAVAATTATTATTTTSGACIADPPETAGPFPADGSNASAGATSDILTASGIVRGDIRSSFLTSTTTAPGVAMKLTITLVDTNSVCSTLQGYAIYLWHCDRSGNYSLYGTAAAETWLRGVQVTDSAGQVTFTTIFPACYAGRYPHIHFEVFASLATATAGRNALLTSQLAMPATVCNTVYPNATGYGQSVANFAQVSIATDGVFGDDTAAQIAAMTPAMTGGVADGYVATATIGVAR